MVRNVSVTGLRELEQALRELGKVNAKAVGRRVLKKAAQPMADAAQAGAPVQSGQLAQSVTVSPRVKKGRGDAGAAAFGAALRAGGDVGTARAAARSANAANTSVMLFMGPASTVRQAVPQEFGTEDHPAQPFMRPAWDGHSGQALDSIIDDLRIEIAKAAQRAAKRAAKAARAKG